MIFGSPLLGMLAIYLIWQWRVDHRARKRLQSAYNSGAGEPVSMHPHIDPVKCIGCGACVRACPEGEILGLIDRKAALVSPADCIGHGACREACPADAITLVFGSAMRGVDIPLLSSEFETSLPGVYIAGELGGMGLIKNAITQGRQAVQAIAGRLQKNHRCPYDLVIVGAGPAGLSAALQATALKLRFAVLEQDSIGGTLAHYPRGKMVMTQPADLPIVGRFQFQEASKEDLVRFWQEVLSKTGVKVQTNVRVDSLSPNENGFVIKTSQNTYRANKVLLTLGRRGTPRKLGVTGEHLSKVVYRLVDPEQYAGRRVLIAGGGDSAVEAAISIARQPGSRVTLCHRGKAFARVKQGNRERLSQAQNGHQLEVILETEVQEIHPHHVVVTGPTGTRNIDNDDVIICVGGMLPTPFLRKSGIEVEAKFGTA